MKREIHQGEVFWSNQPFVKGHIQKGSRPYLVVSVRNNKGYVTVFPITSKIKEINNRCDIVIKNKRQQVIIDQPQTVPISTLGRYLGRIDLENVDECLSRLLYLFNFDI